MNYETKILYNLNLKYNDCCKNPTKIVNNMLGTETTKKKKKEKKKNERKFNQRIMIIIIECLGSI